MRDKEKYNEYMRKYMKKRYDEKAKKEKERKAKEFLESLGYEVKKV